MIKKLVVIFFMAVVIVGCATGKQDMGRNNEIKGFEKLLESFQIGVGNRSESTTSNTDITAGDNSIINSIESIQYLGNLAKDITKQILIGLGLVVGIPFVCVIIMFALSLWISASKEEKRMEVEERRYETTFKIIDNVLATQEKLIEKLNVKI